MKIDTKKILCIISNQIADIINDDEEYYSNLRVEIQEEQMYIGSDDSETPNTIYVVVKFLPASIDYGQTSIPITFQMIGEQNNLERTRNLFNEYANRYNLKWNEDSTMQQVYELPSVISNFNEIYEGFRNILSMPGAILLIENGNDCKVEYYPMLAVDDGVGVLYFDEENNNITKEKNPSINFETLRSAIFYYNKEHDKDIKLEDGNSFEFYYNGYSWSFLKNDTNEKIDSITIYDYGVSYEGYASKGDKITFKLVNGYYELEFIAINTQASISLDSQAFYNNGGFTKSKGKFGSFSINLTTYLFDNEFLNKCLAIYLKDLVREPLGIDTIFKFRITFKSGITSTKDFKMVDFSLQQRKGQLPLVSATFSE